MENLSQIKAVDENISKANIRAIKAFHMLVYQKDGGRHNRRNLKSFPGFSFEDGSAEHKAKLDYIKSDLSVGDVIAVCNILNIDYDGNQDVLAQRICSSLMDINILNNENDETDNDASAANDFNETDNDASGANDSNDDADEQMSVASVQPKFMVNFRDIEDTIRPFNGSDNYPIEKWIDDFDENARMFGWDPLQTFIFAKKSLTGLAKLFIQGESAITSWKLLKGALKEEFSTKVNSAQLHRMLSERKMRKFESVQEYFLIMKELANRGSVEPDALCNYIIDGISGYISSKSILFGATDLKDFKKKLLIYETIRSKSINSKPLKRDDGTSKPKKDDETNKPKKDDGTNKLNQERYDDNNVRCYNCGSRGHRSADCYSKNLGTKCFKCNKFGHIARDCIEKTVANVSAGSQANMQKMINIENVPMMALFDTGSEINLLRLGVYLKMGAPKFQKASITLKGIGQAEIKTIGRFEGQVEIDDLSFTTAIFVLPDDAMPVDVIIGKTLLNEVTLIMNAQTIKIISNKNKTNNEANDEDEETAENGDQIKDDFEDGDVSVLMAIIDENIPNVGCPKDLPTISRMINDYRPRRTKETKMTMKIILKDDIPVHQQPRRLPMLERKEVEKQLEEWLQEGIIRPSSSDYASPIVLVKKKNGQTRICVDYRQLNRKIIQDRFPMPIIEDQVDKLRGAKIFTTLDLKNGFFHVPVDESSIKFTSFVTPSGQYEFRKVPFGLSTSPAVFSRFIDSVFSDMIRDEVVLTYMDDLIIPAKSKEEAFERLKLVLSRAEEFGLDINWKKCQFLKTQIEYLGYQIGDNTIKPSSRKIEAVANFPKLKTVRDVQRYLGLTGYFRKFIQDYSTIAKPLSDMIKKNSVFKFGEKEVLAFDTLKMKLCEEPVLQIFNFGAETELHTDASQDGYGAILLQKCDVDGKMHPIYYMSKKTTDAEKKYHSYELEVLAIVEALKKFRVYLYGNKFKLVTDCSAFQMTMNKKDLVTRVARWALLLDEYDYTIEHRPGKRMQHVDTLSRYPVMIVTTDGVIARIKKAQDEDEELKTIKLLLPEGRHENYMTRNDILYKVVNDVELLVVPKSMQTQIIRDAHQNGHFAVKKVEEVLKQQYYIPDLKSKIIRCIMNCVPCVLMNKKSGKKEGYLCPLQKGELPLNTYHIDHLGPLESTNKNYKHILAVIDDFTKFAWLYPVKSTTSREVIAKLELQKKTFGNPRLIVSDRGTVFSSDEFEDYCKDENIQHRMVTTGLPRANGQIERLNRVIISVLSKLSIENPTKWYHHVDKMQQMLNSTYHRSINTTPFQLLIGTNMNSKTDLKLKEALEQAFIQDFDNERKDLREEAKKQILKIAEENKKTYNLRRKAPKKYQLNDMVAIKRTQLGPGMKLKPKFWGPYKITKVKPGDTYNVERIGRHEGPMTTSTCAEYLKPWVEGDSSEADENAGWPSVGAGPGQGVVEGSV